MNITDDQFRKTLGLFPTGVTVVTACSESKGHIGITISSFTSVSLMPPQILFCLSRKSRTHPIFKDSPYFVVNILNKDQVHLSEGFANHTALKLEEIVTSHHEKSGCLLIGEAMGHIVCEKSVVYDGGDHDIIVGKVIDLTASPDHFPLIRQRGKYHTTGDLTFSSRSIKCPGTT